MSISWDSLYSASAKRLRPSMTHWLSRIIGNKEMISFFAGLPAPELYPARGLAEAVDRALSAEPGAAMGYANPQGYPQLRSYISNKLQAEGCSARPEDLLVLTGSIQGLCLVGEVVLDEGDAVVVERPTFSGAIEVFDKFGPRYVEVPTDQQGMVVDALPDILERSGAKLVYCMPNAHNPLGIDLPVERRRRLAALAQERGVLVVTDDPYGELRYRGDRPPDLLALDPDAPVVAIRSFSKTIAPGIRLGWLQAPRPLMEKLILAKQVDDRCSDHILQRAVVEMGNVGDLDAQREKLIADYRRRLDAMLGAMDQHFPASVRWAKPTAGMFVWVTLPEEIDADELMELAIEEKTAFAPGSSFFAGGGGRNTFRLCFSPVPLERIPEGIARLGRAMRRMGI